MKLIFTTTEPSFMGMGDETDAKPWHETLSGNRSKFDTGGKTISCYIHGELEDKVGFNIPMWLSGTIKNTPVQPATVYSADGTEKYEAIMVLQERETRFYALIILPSDIENFDINRVDYDSPCKED